MALKSDVKFEEKLTCGLENDIKKFGKFLPEQSNVSKLELWWDSFIHSRKPTNLKPTEELCVMTMKIVAKFEEELTLRFKIDMRDLSNFDSTTQKSKKITL